LSSLFLRRGLAVYALSFCAAIVLGDFFFTIPVINAAGATLSQWAAVWASFAILIGLVSFTRYHYGVTRKHEAGVWYMSLWTIILTILVVIMGLTIGVTSKVYMWVWLNFNAWPYRVLNLVQCLYLLSAGYRSFRVRSAESVVLLIAGFIATLGFTPLISLGGGAIPWAATWLANVANAAVVRGMTIGVGVGVVALGLRLMLGKERLTRGEITAPSTGGG
jgi:hypothetical protein